jgi:hypothetical protein
MIPMRRPGDIQFGPVPQYNTGSLEMEQTMLDQADKLVGLQEGSPASQVHLQFFTDKFLSHVAEVLRLAYRNFQRFGPDKVFFRVTGISDPQTISKGTPDENYDVVINFDTLTIDPDAQEKKMQQMAALVPMDRNGIFDMNAFLQMAAASIDPVLADRVLQPSGEAQEKILQQITDDLAKIFAGIEVPARPNGAQIALQVIQQYAAQPDITQRLEQDEAFRTRLEKYAAQYQFMMQQQQNAEIGRVGTQPAQMGGVNTQNMQQ